MFRLDPPVSVPRKTSKNVSKGVFWKITGAGASFQAGSAAVDSATVVASLVNHLTGNVYAVGAASTVLRLGWLLPQLPVGFLAQRVERRMPFYVVGAFGRASCLALIALRLRMSVSPQAVGSWADSSRSGLCMHLSAGLLLCPTMTSLAARSRRVLEVGCWLGASSSAECWLYSAECRLLYYVNEHNSLGSPGKYRQNSDEAHKQIL